MTDKPILSFEQVTSEQWERLAAERIFFGHQSVGGNILEGIVDVLAENKHLPLKIIETTDESQIDAPALYHANVGRNGAPDTKLEAFRDYANAIGNSGTALLKYCYVDVTGDTDAQALFDEYRRTVDSVRAQHPGLRIVHVTLPLYQDIGTVRYVAAVVRRLPTGRDVSLIRHNYNELLRKHYGGKEPIFDLAALEATRSDGTIATVKYQGQRLPVLASEWTYDGGHLNEAGRKRIAKAFLATLAVLE